MSQIIILDTHIWFWFINQQFDKFPTHWREIIETSEQVGVSTISCYEIALAQQRGRLELPCAAANQWFQEALEPSGITLFPVTVEISCRAVNLSPGLVIGPMDMLIAAHAMSLGVTLVTNNIREFSRIPKLSLENWAE
jgi:PIN domain nuclease of toxin-antitoxin system